MPGDDGGGWARRLVITRHGRGATGGGEGDRPSGEHGEAGHEGEHEEAEHGGASGRCDDRSSTPKEGEWNQPDGELGEAKHTGTGDMGPESAKPGGTSDGGDGAKREGAEHEGRRGRGDGKEAEGAEHGGASVSGDDRSGKPEEGDRNQPDGELGEAKHLGTGGAEQASAKPGGTSKGGDGGDARAGTPNEGVMNQHDGEQGEPKPAESRGEDAAHGAEGAEHAANAEGEHTKSNGASSEPTAGEHEGRDVVNTDKKAEPEVGRKRLCEGAGQLGGANATSSVGACSNGESIKSSEPGHIIVSNSSSAESGGSRGQMARISTGIGSTVHTLALWEVDEHTKQPSILRASQHRRTLARTAAGVNTVSQQEAACPRWRQRTQRRWGEPYEPHGLSSSEGRGRPRPRPPARGENRWPRVGAVTGAAPTGDRVVWSERRSTSGGPKGSKVRSQAQHARKVALPAPSRSGEPGTPK